MKLDDFELGPSGIYTGKGVITPAGYLDGAEKYLYEIFNSRRDNGTYSPELKAAIKDWPSLYHLSSYRTTIFDCLEFQRRDVNVLELGAGCGAITRWLGEKFSKVSAIEGSCNRAIVAGLRCRDLSSVNVYAANFLELEYTNRFDVATLIGVLEYSHMYHPVHKESPCKAALSTLKLIFDLLENEGILVLALENKMGLKYFSGAREDHSGRTFDGIHGYPDNNTPVTYSAAEIEDMLDGAGFTSADFYLPFPDYKLASSIINGKYLSTKYYLHNWIDTPFPDRCVSRREVFFNEGLVIRELLKGRMLRELANSFLVVAYKGERKSARERVGLSNEEWIARHYSLSRYAPFCKKVTLVEDRAGAMMVRNEVVCPETEKRKVNGPFFSHALENEKYCPGDQMIFSVFKTIVSGKFETEFIKIVHSLNKFLLERFSSGENDNDGYPLLSGDSLDVLMWNIIVDEKSGAFMTIDREWSCNGAIPVDFVIWRNLYHMILRYKNYFASPFSESTAEKFIIESIRSIYPAFNRDRYGKARALDGCFQDFAHTGKHPGKEELSAIYGYDLGPVEKGRRKIVNDSTSSCSRNRPEQKINGSRNELVSVIIPVMNNLEYTRRCLDALSVNTGHEPYEVIVVDNGSADGTKDYLRCLEGDVKIITNEFNRGFAKACNQGARAAQGDYLVFLNNDTVPQRGWLENLVKVVIERPEVAVVGCKLLYPDNTIQHAGVVFDESVSKLFLSHIYKGFDKDHPAVNHAREFNAVTAACMLVRKNVFFDLKMFDEGYTNGYEDVDFCLKVKERGHRIIYTPESVLYHHESATEGRFSFEGENARHFLNRWKGKITPDYDMKAMEDGLRIERLPDNRIRYHRIDAGKEDAVSLTKKDIIRNDYIKGLECWKEGRRDEGFDMVCRNFKNNPDRKEVLGSIIQMGTELKEYEVVEKSLREYLTYHPADLETLVSLSEILLHLDKPDLAEEELSKVLIFDPGNSRASAIMEEIRNVTRNA